MTPNIRCVQPGEAGLYPLERALGRLRRAWLRRCRPGYVARMRSQRHGACPDCTHDVLDPRDLKLVRNVCGYSFHPTADPFRWRDRLPFARQGLIEVVVYGGTCAAFTLLALALWPAIAWLPALPAAFYLWFFRDPQRRDPSEPGIAVAPCDGVLDDICEVDHCAALDGPAIRLGISLSLFDVHVNRTPLDARVDRLSYHPGVFRNAMRKGDHSNNEQFWTVFDPIAPDLGVLAVRQIAGPLARTIVNEARLDETLPRSAPFGMIKFGSRTELYLPRESGYEICATLGQRMVGGVTPVLRHTAPDRSG